MNETTSSDQHQPVQSAGTTNSKPKQRYRRREPDEMDLSPQELHRKRNREALQRARKREREKLEQMKLTLQELTQQYAQLHEQFQAQQQTPSQPAEKQLIAKFLALADLSHALKEEEYQLEKALHDKQLTHQRVRQALLDRATELKLPNSTLTSSSELYADFEYTPITEVEVAARIRQSYQSMRALEATAQPLPNITPCCCSSSTFGWEVTCKIATPNAFFACFSRFFPGVSPYTAMQRVWEEEVQRKLLCTLPNRPLLRCKLLQTLKDGTFVLGTDHQHPVEKDKIMRSIYLTYRLETESDGYAIGNSSVNPASSVLRSMAEEQFGVVYVDWGSWMEFLPEVDAVTGESGCRLKCYDRTDYNTQEDTYFRLLNALRCALLWEDIVSPSSSLQLLPS